MRFYRIFWLVFGVLPPVVAVASWRFHVTQLPNQRQLPVANVHRILQDCEGYMWYATEGGGLCRDDGYRVEVFRSDKHRPSLLAANDITCLDEDEQGRIWFGTTKGLHLLDKKNYRIHRLDDAGVKGMPVSCLLAASGGAVWVSVGDTIFCYRPRMAACPGNGRAVPTIGGWELVRYPSRWNGQPCGVSNFFKDGCGNILALQSRGGLLGYNPGTDRWEEWQWPFDTRPGFLADGSHAGSYWAATWGHGVVKYERASSDTPAKVVLQRATQNPDEPGGFRSQVLNILYEKNRCLLWVATMDNLYVYRTDGDTLVPYPTDGFLAKGKKILDNVTLDRDGNLWVPGYSPHTFIVHAEVPCLRRDSVRAMSEATGYRVMVDRMARENDSLYWIWQGRTGLSLYNARGSSMTFAREAARPAPLDVAKCLERRKTAPGIWTCGGNRLFRVWHRDMMIEWAEEAAAVVEEAILVLRDDGKGRLYIGTFDALYCYDYRRAAIRRLAAAVGPVRDIAVLSDESVWFVSDKKGCCLLKPSASRAVAVPARSADGSVLTGFSSLAVAPDGTVWAATSRGNVCRYMSADGRFDDDETAGNRNGDAVKALVADGYGCLWILSDSYLKVYNPTDGAVRFFHSSDSSVNMDYFHTLSLEGDSVCLGGIGAFCMIAASDAFAGQTSPPVATLVKLDGEPRFPSLGEHRIQLAHGVGRVEVFVSTFDYLHTDSIRFAWRLRAHDEWTELAPGDNRIVLEGLPVGTSVLEVRATDRFGYWREPVECLLFSRQAVARGVWFSFTLLIIGAIAWYWRRVRSKTEVSGPETLVPSRNGPLQSLPSSKPDDDFLRRATETVERNLDNAGYSVEQFSADMCMSRMNLYRKLQMLTAQKPSEFVRDIRLRRAAELMQDTDLSLAEVVDRVGFGTSRYFSKCFKEKYGVSPSQYRLGRPDAGSSL